MHAIASDSLQIYIFFLSLRSTTVCDQCTMNIFKWACETHFDLDRTKEMIAQVKNYDLCTWTNHLLTNNRQNRHWRWHGVAVRDNIVSFYFLLQKLYSRATFNKIKTVCFNVIYLRIFHFIPQLFMILVMFCDMSE